MSQPHQSQRMTKCVSRWMMWCLQHIHRVKVRFRRHFNAGSKETRYAGGNCTTVGPRGPPKRETSMENRMNEQAAATKGAKGNACKMLTVFVRQKGNSR